MSWLGEVWRNGSRPSGFAQKQQSTDFPAARGDEFRKNAGLTEKGYALRYASPTNQVFCVIENAAMERLTGRAEFGFWETYDETHTVIRFAAGWSTTMEEAEALCAAL